MTKVKKPPVADGVEVLEFEFGGWWAFHMEPTRRMRKAFRKASLGMLAIDGIEELDTADEDAVKAFYLAHPTEVDIDSLEDAYLLNGTVDWSWPEEVTLDAIDSRLDRHTALVLVRVKALYNEEDEEEASGEEAGTSPSGQLATVPLTES
jgi:hypothetical protein